MSEAKSWFTAEGWRPDLTRYAARSELWQRIANDRTDALRTWMGRIIRHGSRPASELIEELCYSNPADTDDFLLTAERGEWIVRGELDPSPSMICFGVQGSYAPEMLKPDIALPRFYSWHIGPGAPREAGRRTGPGDAGKTRS